MIIDELIAILGYDVKGEGELDRFNRGLDRAQQHAERFAGRINALSIAFGTFLGNMATQIAQGIGSKIGSLPGDILDVGKKFEAYGIQLKALEGSQVAAYAQMRTFGLDPTNGSLQAMVDTMAMSGTGQEQLQGIILAVGQAWTAQKLQGQDAMQLMQRGVPVWDILSKAMGKSVEDVQKLSKAGKLGRKEIQLLIDEMGKRAAGASDEFAKSFEGITSNISDIWTGFLKQISDKGYFDEIKRRLSGVLDALNEWDKSGALDRWAQSISNGFVRTIQAAERWGKAIGKIASFVGGHLGQTFANFLRMISGGRIDLSKWEGLAAAFGLLLAVLSPMTAVMVGVILAFDDFFGYLAGSESMIGYFIDYVSQNFPIVADTFAGVLDAMGHYWNSWRALFSGDLAGFTSEYTAFWKSLGTIAKNLWDNGLSDLAGALTSKLNDALQAGLSIDWSELGSRASGAITSALDAATQGFIDLAPKLAEKLESIDWAAAGHVAGNALASALGLGVKTGWDTVGLVTAITAGLAAGLMNLSWADIGAAWYRAMKAELDAISRMIAGVGLGIKDKIVSWFDGISLSDVGARLGRSLLDGLVSVGESIRGWFDSLIPGWAKEWFAEGEARQQGASAGAMVGAMAPPATPTDDRNAGAPPSTRNRISTRQRAEAANADGGNALRAMLENMNANLAKMTPERAVNATVTDARQDSRNQSVTVNSTVNQTVTQAAQAPDAAARATSQAVGQAAVPQAGRLAVDSAF
ncbi:MAG: tape measure protein [Rhizobiales bacterium]|nr:tape measure protein [Hyphomicrobiales bacterium]